MATNELERFLGSWHHEAHDTVRFLHMLPPTQYDFRPDPGGRSLGELAWHLAEIEAYVTHGIERSTFDGRPPNIDRPRTIEALAPRYVEVHEQAVARVALLTPGDFDRSLTYFSGQQTIRNLLFNAILSHTIHHRGQLSVLCRLAGGTVPSLYGPTREDVAARHAPFPEKPLLDRAYAAFNARRLDEALGLMQENVTWPNGMEGGYLHGRQAVREYWTRQWLQIDPRVHARQYARDPDGRVAIDVDQVVCDLAGVILSARTVQHVYEVRDGLIASMEIRATTREGAIDDGALKSNV